LVGLSWIIGSSFAIITQVGRPIMDNWVQFCNNNGSW
jgi:hypothetical protein